MDCDAVVIGAGFAGAAAAHQLSKAGLKVIVLEARDRVGGRALTRPFGGSGDRLEFGGSWITPWQKRIRGYAEAHGITLSPTQPILELRYHDGAALRVGEACSEAAKPAFARSMERIRADTLAYQAGERSNAGIALDAYLDMIGASAEARIHVMAWWTISGNGDPGRISAAEFLSSCGYGGGTPEGMMTALRHTMLPGAAVLVERMIEASGATLWLDTPVNLIQQNSNSVRVNGLQARHAALCVPLNVIASINFDPPLQARQSQAAQTGHGGNAIKMWIKARGVKVGTLATGGGGGLQWMFAESQAEDGAALIVAFGLGNGSFDPRSPGDVEAALHRLFPEAELLSWDWHDWVNDPWAKGTWVATPADALWIAEAATWRSHGRVVFASSDFSHEQPGWFEAAIAAGEQAAAAITGQTG